MKPSGKQSIVKIVIVAGVAVALALAMASCDSAAGQSRDSFSTSTYLHARDTFESNSASSLPASRAGVDAFIAHVSNTCSGVLKNTPAEPSVMRRSNGELSISGRSSLLVDITNSLEGVFIRPRSGALRQFTDTVKELEWSDHKVTEVVRAFVAAEATSIKAPVADICNDARAWVASGYSKFPTSAAQFESAWEAVSGRLSRKLTALGCSTQYPELGILQILKRYQNPREQTTDRRLMRREQTRATADRVILSRAITLIEHALGVPGMRRQSATGKGAQRRVDVTPKRVCGSGGPEIAAPPSAPLPNVPSQP